MPLNIIQPVQPINWQGINDLTNNLRENKLLRRSEELTQQALSGNPNALSGLYSVNPHAAKFIHEQQQTSKKERQAEGMNYARGAVISLLQAPAEQRPQLWKQAVGRGKQEYGEMFGAVPDEYSDQAFNEILSRASEDKIISKVLEQRLGLQSENVPADLQVMGAAQNWTPAQWDVYNKLHPQKAGKEQDPYIKLSPGDQLIDPSVLGKGVNIGAMYSAPFAPKSAAEGTAIVNPETGEQLVAPRPKTSPAPYGADPAAPVPQQLEQLGAVEAAKETAQKTAATQVEKQANRPQADNALRTSLERLKLARDEAQAIRDSGALESATGLSGAVTRRIPGSGAYDIGSRLTTLQAQSAFAALQAIREASKTGGALGAVSERELELLQNATTALDPGQSKEAMQASLNRLIKQIETTEQNMLKAYQQTYGGQAEAAPSAPSQPKAPTKSMTSAQLQAYIAKKAAQGQTVTMDEAKRRAAAAGYAVQ